MAEAVDEALAQLVAAGGHLDDPDAVKALWITCARRRLIDEQRSAEVRHRSLASGDDVTVVLAGSECDEPTRLTDDERQWWRIREILGVLRGDQRVWAEAWYDRVLSASRVSFGQPRGLADALGWSPAKTKSVSRRARMRMAAFIEDRISGIVCEEQRALMDSLIVAGRSSAAADARDHDVLVHIAGCEVCWATWHARRRDLLGRCRSALGIPLDGLAILSHTLAGKIAGAAVGAHSQSSALLARVGFGSAAAASGGAATIGGKTAAVCVGVVCAATAGGELVGVLPLAADRPRTTRSVAAPTKPLAKPVDQTVPQTVQHPVTAATEVAPSARAGVPAQVKATAARAIKEAAKPVVAGTPGDLPPAGSSPSSTSTASSGSGAPQTAPAGTFAATDSTSTPSPPPATSEAKAATCVPGSLGC